jgi:hypothetical protein
VETVSCLQDEQQRGAVPDLGGDVSSSSTTRQANIKCARCYSLVHYGWVGQLPLRSPCWLAGFCPNVEQPMMAPRAFAVVVQILVLQCFFKQYLDLSIWGLLHVCCFVCIGRAARRWVSLVFHVLHYSCASCRRRDSFLTCPS